MFSFKSIKVFFYARYLKWLRRRLPVSKEVELTQRRIFIMPTKEGVLFGALLLVMLLVSINYQNSMGFMLTFLLGSIFVVSILHTYKNLSGLILKVGRTSSGFCGEDIKFEVILGSALKRHYSIELGWPGSVLKSLDVDVNEHLVTKLYLRSERRGLFVPERMLVQTRYPVGILRSWSWVYLDMSALVYPEPIHSKALPVSISMVDEGVAAAMEGSDDFAGLQNYQKGDSLKHIAWKQFARGQSLHTKKFESYVDKQTWLDWDWLKGIETEHRLSIICGWVLSLNKAGQEYGLRLPGCEIPPGKGDGHRMDVLKALALFGK